MCFFAFGYGMINNIEINVLMTRCIRWKYIRVEDGYSQLLQMMRLNWNEEGDEDPIDIVEHYPQIELIIIPDRYLSDEEVIQTLHVRHDAHLRKHRMAYIFSATDMTNLLSANAVTADVLERVYKISTIRHGFSTETCDENKALMIELAKKCVETQSDLLTEISLRCCYGAGDLNEGLMTLEDNVLIGHMAKMQEYSDAEKSDIFQFLYGNIEQIRTSEYAFFKNKSIRTQTVNVQQVGLLNPQSPNVLYDFRMTLNDIPELRKLSVKGYYGRVNPVPEQLPNRLGIWFSRDRPPSLIHPKSVRLLG